MRSCIFCDGPASTKEDAWPHWLMRLLGGNIGIIEAERSGKEPQSWRASGLRVKFICSNCNNGWMSQLENRVKPIVESLFSEKRVTLDSHDQATLAAWSFKNAMVFEALRLNRSWFFDESERRSLRLAQQPVPWTSVWIAKCVDYGGDFCLGVDLKGVAGASPNEVKVYLTTMSFGPLAIQVLSGKLPEAVMLNTTVTADLRPEPWDRTTLRIWPVQREGVAWPTSVGLVGLVGLEKFSKRWSPNNE